MRNHFKNILKIFRHKSKDTWPLPKYNNTQPHMLFLLTPPYSGSTAIAKLLDSSKRTATLCENGEGQWLIPKLIEEDRWDIDKPINFDSIKAVWLNKYQQIKKKQPDVDVIIEKSPPNMMRIEALAAMFDSVSFIANNRNPYANCSSVFYRKYLTDEINNVQRKVIIKQLIDDWLTRSYKIQQLIKTLEIPLLTYEKFCKKPASIIDILDLPRGVIETINVEGKVKVKDYEPQPIVNQNERQISKLTPDDMAIISKQLSAHEELMAFYNYKIRG